MQQNEKVSFNEREKNKKAKIKRLHKKASTIKSRIWIGKEGITSTFIEQLNNQLKTNKLVKVKIQKNILENEKIEEIAQKVAKETNSNLIDVRGRTFSLFKPND